MELDNQVASQRAPKHYNYIDALRGYAILMVIAVHALPNSDLIGPWWMRKLTVQGARGVQLFFVVSALTLCMSWTARKDTSGDFYFRRLFRIAPMYWLAMPFYLWLNGWEENGIRQVVTAGVFLHALWPDTFAGVVPGGWSVGNEALFYAIFPFVVPALINCRWQTFGVVMATTIIGGAQVSRLLGNWFGLHPELQMNHGSHFFTFWFPREFPAFLLGIALFRLSSEGYKASTRAANWFIAIGVATFVAVAMLDGVRHALPRGNQVSASMAFVVVIFGMMNGGASWLANHAAVWIGKVSFSVYIIHFAVNAKLPSVQYFGLQPNHWSTYLAHFLAVAAVSIVVGSITYRLIEQPAIELGSRLRPEKKRTPPPLVERYQMTRKIHGTTIDG